MLTTAPTTPSSTDSTKDNAKLLAGIDGWGVEVPDTPTLRAATSRSVM